MNGKKILLSIVALYGSCLSSVRVQGEEVEITLTWPKSIAKEAVAFVEGKKTYLLNKECTHQIMCSRKINIDTSTVPFQFNTHRQQPEVSLDALSHTIQDKLHHDQKLTHYTIKKITIDNNSYEPNSRIDKISYDNFINIDLVFELQQKNKQSGSLHPFSQPLATIKSKQDPNVYTTALKVQWSKPISPEGVFRKQWCPTTPAFTTSYEINPQKCSIIYQDTIEEKAVASREGLAEAAPLTSIIRELQLLIKKNPKLRQYGITRLLNPSENPLNTSQEYSKEIVFLLEKES